MSLHDFQKTMADVGIVYHDSLAADGALHRFHIEGDKTGTRNGWYVLYDDTPLAGAFGSWKTGVSETWCSESNDALTPDEKRAWRQKMDKAKAARKAEEKRVHDEAAEEATKQWDDAKPETGGHKYLNTKCIRPNGVRN